MATLNENIVKTFLQDDQRFATAQAHGVLYGNINAYRALETAVSIIPDGDDSNVVDNAYWHMVNEISVYPNPIVK